MTARKNISSDGRRPGPGRSPRRSTPPRYAELRAASAFSFLRGASQPEDLMERAAELELPAVALTDRNGVYGAPRFFGAAREAGVRALVGAEVVIDDRPAGGPEATRGRGGPGRSAARSRRSGRGHPRRRTRLTLLAENRTGYRNLCRLLTAAALRPAEGRSPRHLGTRSPPTPPGSTA